MCSAKAGIEIWHAKTSLLSPHKLVDHNKVPSIVGLVVLKTLSSSIVLAAVASRVYEPLMGEVMRAEY